MAIINCPECGKEISDAAEKCIYCGYPLREPAAAPEKKSIVSILADFAGKYGKIGVVILIVAAVAAAGTLISRNTFTEREQEAYDAAARYKRMLKDPDSMVLRGDILYVKDSEFNTFVAFSASGNNSYGTPVTSMPMFMDGSYIGNYQDEPSELEDREDKLNLAKGNLVVASWNLIGKNMANDDRYLEAELISGKKVAARLKCEWKEE